MSFSESLEYIRNSTDDDDVYYECYDEVYNTIKSILKNSSNNIISFNVSSAGVTPTDYFSYNNFLIDAILKIDDKFYKAPVNLSSWYDNRSLGYIDIRTDVVEVFPVTKEVVVYEEKI